MTDDLLTVGTLSAAPGTKTRGTVPADLGALTVDIPLTLVNGARPGPRVLITAGVHGGEFTGIEAATRLASLLEPSQVHGQVIICPVANPPAVYQGRLGISPLDGVNINRVFPGDPDGGPTERLAAWLFAHLLDGADAYADLHAGGIDEVLRNFVGYRLTGDAPHDAKTADMARSLGIEDIVIGLDTKGGNSQAAAARAADPGDPRRDRPTRRTRPGRRPTPGRRPARPAPRAQGPHPRRHNGRPRTRMGLGRLHRLRTNRPVVPGVHRRRRRDRGPDHRPRHSPRRRPGTQGPHPVRRTRLLRHARPDGSPRHRTGSHRHPPPAR